jgi:hypothetical protein
MARDATTNDAGDVDLLMIGFGAERPVERSCPVLGRGRSQTASRTQWV